MFYFKQNRHQEEKLNKLFKKVKALYGTIPPQMHWLGNIEALYLEEFLKSTLRILKHPNIHTDFFAFIRLYVAHHEDYEYCKKFNTALLISRGYEQSLLNSVISDISKIPLDKKHKSLAQKAIKAIFEYKSFEKKDFEDLFLDGWSQKDIFDAIEHAGTILKNGRILAAYTIK